jgi:predicted component of type VI protein secretion system
MARANALCGLLQRVDGKPVADLVQDVLQHLDNLLNMKRDYGSFVPGLGLSISDTMWSVRPMRDLADHIRGQIEAFEPRMRNPTVEPAPFDEDNSPVFRVRGRIGTSTVQLTLSLHTVYCSVHVTQD